MRDFNFFIIYSKDYQRRFNRDSPFLKAALVVLLFMLTASGLSAWNGLTDGKNKMKAMELTTITQAPGYIETMKLHRQKEAMAAYDEKASLAIEKLKNAGTLGSSLLTDVTGKVPKAITVESLDINMDTMNIDCFAPDRKAVAEFQLRLRELPFVGEVHVGSVEDRDEDTGVEATLECAIIREGGAE
ncbi:hypothetical protein MASR2M70_15810 [Bacillota bacterium]